MSARERIGRVILRVGLRVTFGPRGKYMEVLINGKPDEVAPDAGQREAQEMCSACDVTGVKCDETAGCCEVCRATGGCSHDTTRPDRSPEQP